MLIGSNQVAWFGADPADGSERQAAPGLAEIVALFHRDCEIVLVEGYRAAGLPAIVVHRPGNDDPRWTPPEPSLVVATVHPGDVEHVADLLEARYLR
jgi:molybdopterin-guanine dinucleotide biosynthesis protein